MSTQQTPQPFSVQQLRSLELLQPGMSILEWQEAVMQDAVRRTEQAWRETVALIHDGYVRIDPETYQATLAPDPAKPVLNDELAGPSRPDAPRLGGLGR